MTFYSTVSKSFKISIFWIILICITLFLIVLLSWYSACMFLVKIHCLSFPLCSAHVMIWCYLEPFHREAVWANCMITSCLTHVHACIHWSIFRWLYLPVLFASSVLPIAQPTYPFSGIMWATLLLKYSFSFSASTLFFSFVGTPTSYYYCYRRCPYNGLTKWKGLATASEILYPLTGI